MSMEITTELCILYAYLGLSIDVHNMHSKTLDLFIKIAEQLKGGRGGGGNPKIRSIYQQENFSFKNSGDIRLRRIQIGKN